jgi:hypothetical protein
MDAHTRNIQATSFNALVDILIKANQTYSLDTGNGILKIELGFKGMKELKYCGWWDHDHYQMFYGETPYDVYSDLLSGAKECGSN